MSRVESIKSLRLESDLIRVYSKDSKDSKDSNDSKSINY